MNKRQRKKKISKMRYLWGHSYQEIKVYVRELHELHIKYLHQHRKYWEREGK